MIKIILRIAYLCLVVSFTILSGNSQNSYQIVIDDASFGKYRPNQVAIFCDSILLVSIEAIYQGCPNVSFYAFILNGEQLWRKDWQGEIFYVDESTIYTLDYSHFRDYGFPSILISQIDKTGEEVLYFEYPDSIINELGYGAPYPIDIIILSDQNILIVSRDGYMKFSPSGELLDGATVNLESDIVSIKLLEDGHVIVQTANALYKLDTLLATIDSIHFDSAIVDMDVSSESILVLQNERLVELSHDLLIVDEFSSGEIGSLRQLRLYQDEVWVLNDLGSSYDLIRIENDIEAESISLSSAIDIFDFLISDSQIIITGKSPLDQVYVESLDRISPIPESNFPDIELIEVKTFATQIDTAFVYGFDTFIYGFKFDADIFVMNHSDEIVNSFGFYGYLQGGFNCIIGYYYKKFDDVDIPPGETFSAHIKDIYQGSGQTSICFEVLAPNSSLESSIEDNRLCKDNVITSIDNITQIENHILVYPNPVSDYLTVFSEMDISDWVISNIQGQQFLTSSGIELLGRNLTMDVSTLPRGIYILTMFGNHGLMSSKVIVR